MSRAATDLAGITGDGDPRRAGRVGDPALGSEVARPRSGVPTTNGSTDTRGDVAAEEPWGRGIPLLRLVEQSRAILWTTDADLRFTAALGAGLPELGLGPGQVVGLTLSEFFGTDDPEYGPIAAHRQARAGSPVNYDSEWQGRTFQSHVEPLLGSGGAIAGVVGVALDVTERKRVEEALRDGEQRYRALVAAAERQSRELALLDEVRTALARELELPVVFRTVVEATANAFGYTMVSLYLIDDGMLHLQHQVGYHQVLDRIPLQRGVMGRVARTGVPVLLEDGRVDPDFLAAFAGIVSEVCVPLHDQGRVVGVLNLESTGGVRLGEADLRLLLALSEHVGIAIGRARLYTEARENKRKYRTVVEGVREVIYQTDPAGRWRFLNPAWTELTGFGLDESIGREAAAFFHPEDRPCVLDAFRALTDGEQEHRHAEARYLAKSGDVCWLELHARRTPAIDGQPAGTSGTLNDITERKRAERALRRSEQRFRSLVQNASDLVAILDKDGTRRYVSPAIERVLGYPPAEMIGANVFALIHPDDAPRVRRFFADAVARPGQTLAVEMRLRHRDGTWRWFEAVGSSRFDEPSVGGIVINSRDITEHKALAADALRHAAEQAALLRVSQAVVSGLELPAVLAEVARASLGVAGAEACEILLWLPESDEVEVAAAEYDSGRFHPAGIGARHPLADWPTARAVLGAHQSRPVHVDDPTLPERERRGYTAAGFRGGLLVPLLIGSRCLGLLGLFAGDADAFGSAAVRFGQELAAQAALAVDRVRLDAALQQRADTDGLTDLFNHRAILEALDAELRRAAENGDRLSVLLLDIDDFKLFNDTHGHLVGDGVLRDVAALLRASLRDGDWAGRYGGDEFLLVLTGAGAAGARRVAGRIQAEAAARSIAVGGLRLPLKLSIGCATFPTEGESRPELLAFADAALYAAKDAGGDQPRGRGGVAAVPPPTPLGALSGLVRAVDRKDRYTKVHSDLVSRTAVRFGARLGLEPEQVEALEVAGHLHDVGKIAVPDVILRKPGYLTEDERATIRQHVAFGELMIQGVPHPDLVRQAVSHHHERWDGGGYPHGKRAAEIPLLGRILALADAYAALVHDRPYRRGRSLPEAIAELRAGAGTQFDPSLVEPFIAAVAGDGTDPGSPLA